MEPSRPQKILVCDRELQFFLRGALQGLDIKVDYAPKLPLIEEVCEGLQTMIKPEPPPIPDAQAQPLMAAAEQLWQDAPWELLADHKIIAIDIQYEGLETLYASLLGQLGMEYGVLLYRSQDSLRQFRQEVVAHDTSPDDMEAADVAFLKQDCLFVNFEPAKGAHAQPRAWGTDHDTREANYYQCSIYFWEYSSPGRITTFSG